MVRIAIAGGSGQVAREVLDVLVATGRHDITILSRREQPGSSPAPGVEWQTVDYGDAEALARSLRGIHTVLSFVQPLSDPGQRSQKNLIDAAVAAGVKRFAPSEYGSKGLEDMPWWQGKGEIREYLRELNAQGDVLEYTLFQPGLFLNYLAYPHRTAAHLDPLQCVFDFAGCRAIVADDDAPVTLTTVADLAAVVARAVECGDGVRWPAEGGVAGDRLTFAEVVALGERVRGREFAVDRVDVEDLERGALRASWGLSAVHHAAAAAAAAAAAGTADDDDEVAALLEAVAVGTLLSSHKGAWDSEGQWNRLLPDYRFTSAAEFLGEVWKDRV